MSGRIYVSLLALVMTATACSSEPASPPPVEKKSSKELSASKSGGDDGDSDSSSNSKDKSPSAYHIRQNRKQTLDMELQLLEEDLRFAMGNYDKLRDQKYRTLERTIPGQSDATVQGKLAEAGTSFLFGGLGLAISGIGSAGAAASSASAVSKEVSSQLGKAGVGGGSSQMGGFTNGFNAIGDAVSVGINKAENAKTIKRITGTVEEMMQQWQTEIDNIQAQIDQKIAEKDSLVNMGV